MASEVATHILKSKTGMTVAEIGILSDADAWDIIFSFRNEKAKIDGNRLQISFVGFDIGKTAELCRKAQSYGMEVLATVTDSLDYLCFCKELAPEFAGLPESQGTQLIEESDFLHMLGTGEIPKAP